MKIAAPQLPSRLEEASVDELLSGDIEEVIIKGVDATNCHIIALEMFGVKLEKVCLSMAQCERASIRDSELAGSDLSAMYLANGGINRTVFTDCRMTGVDMSKTTLHDIIFNNCKLDMANLRFANLRRVKFIGCTLSDTDFLGASLHDVTFESCQLERTVFDQVTCKRVDLRTSELSELVGWTSLKDVTIDGTQLVSVAPYLAQALGIKVEY